MSAGREISRTASPEETESVARALASRTTPGDAVLLEGDLGAGKTVFVRGLAAGLGADPAEVASPTFALVHEYGPLERPVLVHVDRYRLLGGAGEDRDLGLDEPRVASAVLAVEWPAREDRARPGWDVEIAVGGDGSRLVTVTRRATPPAAG